MKKTVSVLSEQLSEAIRVVVGDRIAKKRELSGLTQAQVAERLGIGNDAISRMERGESAPTYLRLYELAALFGCSIVEITMLENGGGDDEFISTVRHLTMGASAEKKQFVLNFLGSIRGLDITAIDHAPSYGANHDPDGLMELRKPEEA